MPDSLRLGSLIGSGGEGSVYEHPDDPRMVIKVLHKQYATTERAAKLQAMRDNPPQNAQALGWPNAVEQGAEGLRYQMPKAPRGAQTAYRFISANERKQLPWHQQGYEYRKNIGVRIAEAFRELHIIGVLVGDVNPSNILVSNDGSVMLIDCDSFQVPSRPGHQPYPCVVGSPEYTAPEVEDFRRQFRSQDSDNFALAVLLYQLLGNGSHPYQGIDTSAADAVSNIRERIKQHRFAHNPQNGRWRATPPQMKGWRAMPEPVQDAFYRAFSPTAHSLNRPTSDMWARILAAAARPERLDNVNPRSHGTAVAARPERLDRVKLVAWTLPALAIGTVGGYGTGLRMANAHFNDWALLAVIAFGVLLVLSPLFLKRLSRRFRFLQFFSGRHLAHLLRSLWRNLWRPIEGNRKRTRWGLAGCVLGAVIAGGGAGFGLGIWTAPALFEALSLIGMVIFFAIAGVTAFLCLLLILRAVVEERQQQGRGYPYRRYRRRKW